MNRRFSFLVVALVVAGIISVNGAFSQPTPQTMTAMGVLYETPGKRVFEPPPDLKLMPNK